MRNHGASSIYIFLSGSSSLFFSMIFTIELIYQVKTIGLNPLQLVLVGSLQQLVHFLFQTPTGVLADMYGRRRAVVLGLLLVGVGYLVEGTLPLYTAVLLGAGIGGLGATMMDGADSAWIADEIGAEQVGLVYIRAEQVGTFASLVGIAISSALAPIGLNLPILLGGSLCVVLSVILELIMPEQHFMPAQRKDRSSLQQMGHTLRTGMSMVYRRPVLLTILSISAFYGLFSEGFGRFWPYHLLSRFTLPSLAGFPPVVWFGVIEAGIVVTNLIGIEIARRLIDTNSHHAVAWTLLAIDGLTAIGVVGFALAGQFALALAVFWLITTVIGPRTSLERVWMNQNLVSSVRATIFSLQGQVASLASITGGPLLGLIATAFSTRIGLIVAAIILVPALLLYDRTARYDKPLTAPDESNRDIRKTG